MKTANNTANAEKRTEYMQTFTEANNTTDQDFVLKMELKQREPLRSISQARASNFTYSKQRTMPKDLRLNLTQKRPTTSDMGRGETKAVINMSLADGQISMD